jgi:hypothetical protein
MWCIGFSQDYYRQDRFAGLLPPSCRVTKYIARQKKTAHLPCADKFRNEK